MILDSVRLTTLTVMSVVPSGRVRTGRAQELEWEAGSDLLRATRAALGEATGIGVGVAPAVSSSP